MRDFGIRGVQAGNYVTDDDRAHHTRQAFVALHGLADVLQIPRETISYNGRLGLAFGARGGGKAAAHYEPSLKVINITRNRGGGSLAHEWGHFLDHMLGEQTKSRGMRLGSLLTEIIPESIEGDNNNAIKNASVGVLSAMAGTKFSADAEELGAYWKRPCEMFARAFESYVAEKLKEKQQRNTYLVRTQRQDHPYGMTDKGEAVYAYPQGKERTAINAAFGVFFDALRGSETLKKAFK